jgi:hypothetical protein
MKITFTGAHSQIGKYIKGQYHTTSYDLFDEDTWPSLLESDILFLLLPKNKNTLEKAKQFILSAMDSNIKQIIKIGSLGPWRLIHNQLNHFIRESRIPYTSFNIAPLMNNIFTEQYNGDEKVFYDYRNNAPAPYLDPVCLAKAIEDSMGKEIHFNKDYSCTGKIQYTTDEVVEILKSKNYDVQKIVDTSNGTLHSMKDDNNDFIMMKHIANRYKTEGWYPPISDDLPSVFNSHSRPLEQFIDEDVDIFQQKLADDNCL